MANEVAKKDTFSVALIRELESISDALPVGFNTSRYVQNAVALLNDNEVLMNYAKKYGTKNIKLGLIRGACLDLDASNKEFHLIPYGADINVTIDYRGKKKLAKKYSIRPVKEIYARLVRQGDEFEESIINGEPSINFKPKPFNDGEIVGAFAVCLFKDGGMVCESMSKKEIELIRSSSKAKNGIPWQKFYGEMAKKSCLHRLCKSLELQFENPDQRKYFDEDMEIETDPQKLAESDIEANANTEVFDTDADIVEG